jgi:hypothetical protein
LWLRFGGILAAILSACQNPAGVLRCVSSRFVGKTAEGYFILFELIGLKIVKI